MLLKTKNLNKQFGSMYALKDVDIEIAPGEIHGLVGENGAGKSTLIKILTGVYSLDQGEIFWQGEKVSINNPRQSQKIGINVIHQDRNLIPSFNGIENVYLGRHYETKNNVVVDWDSMKKKVVDLMEELEISVPLDMMASLLTPPQQTLLEIVRAMMTQCKLLILDEPTASLTDKETRILFSTIKKLKANGTSILYVTHRMDEITDLTDRVTVLKNGQRVKTVKTCEVNKDQIISLMTDNWSSEQQQVDKNVGETLLSVRNIASKDSIVHNGTFDVKAGEILGVFGLGGSGRTELLECIYGYRKCADGQVFIGDQELDNRTPAKSIDSRMALICEDRRGMALVGNRSVKENIVLSILKKYSKFGFVDMKKEISDTNDKIKALDIKTNGHHQIISELSGGNQQKVVFAKALMSNPKVVLCDEPTQAVDVKTREEIHKLLKELAKDGAAVVFVSSDLKEVLEISDSIQVMAAGRTKERFINENLTAEQILRCCYAE
jgi:ribose transport system ATP-binding protein